MFQMRAYAALMVARTVTDPRPLLRSAVRDARRIRCGGPRWSEGLSWLIQGGVARARGNAAGARALAAAALARFEALHVGLYAAAARHRRGEILSGEEGQTLAAQAKAWMTGQQIRNRTARPRFMARGSHRLRPVSGLSPRAGSHVS